MAEVHTLVGYAAVVLLALLAGLVVVSTWMGPPSWLGTIWLGAIVLAVFQLALGLLLLVSGYAPTDPTHVVYGIVVTGVLLGVPILTSALQDRSRLRLLAVSAAIAATVAIRLLQTG